ncbi:hypothetical protein [Brevibacillus laterosporus]|nr:hypothetical protein [Brevibacillus laterosporus]
MAEMNTNEMELNRQKITVVDGICGVRLLGVLMANVLIFQYGQSMKKTS